VNSEIHSEAVIEISKKHFHPGGMAASEWTRSVRAVRDTPVAVYSAPGINTTRCVAYNSSITLSVCSVGPLFYTNNLALWPTVTIRQNGFIGYTLASKKQCNQ
jgi:hypothetical protein